MFFFLRTKLRKVLILIIIIIVPIDIGPLKDRSKLEHFSFSWRYWCQVQWHHGNTELALRDRDAYFSVFERFRVFPLIVSRGRGVHAVNEGDATGAGGACCEGWVVGW